MNSTEIRLLKYLYSKNEWKTSKMLSTHLDVSVRNVKYCVNNINSELSCIESSEKGYKLIAEKKNEVFNIINNEEKYAENSFDRQQIILKKLFTNTDGVDIFDLSEELAVSDSTIRQDLSKIRFFLNERLLSLELVNERYHVSGDEKAKRKVMSSIISQEVNDGRLLANAIDNIIENSTYEKMKKILCNVLNDNNYFVTDFALLNLMIHLIVIVDRVRKDRKLEEKSILNVNDNTKEYHISKELFYQYSNLLGLKFIDEEICDFSLLLESMVMPSNYLELEDRSNIEKVIGKDTLQLVDKIVSKVSENFFVDLQINNFYLKFALHIKNLIARIKNSNSNANPYVEVIKNSYPLIYEVSVFIANVIYEEKGYKINDDEITYMAMHLGCVFEKDSEDRLISTVLVCPSYYDMAQIAARKINSSLSDIVNVVKVVTDDKDVKNDGFELILTTQRDCKDYGDKVVYVTPIISGKDIAHIKKAAERIRALKKNDQIRKYLEPLFDCSLFFTDKDFTKEQDIVKILCDYLVDKNYVDFDYYDYVLKREELSSTVFGNTAIPHSLKPMGKKSVICACVFKKSRQVFEKQVNIIFLLSIAPKDQAKFNEIFSKLTEIVLGETTQQKLLKCDSYDKFIALLAEGFIQ